MEQIAGAVLALVLGISVAVTPEQQYKAMLKDYDEAFQNYAKAYSAAPTPDDRQKVVQQKYPRPEKYSAKLLELAEQNPKAPFAEEALIWIVTNEYWLWQFKPWYDHKSRYEQIWILANASRRIPGEQDIRTKATGLLLRDHVASAKLGRVAEILGSSQDQNSAALLRVILEKSPSKEVQAEACVALARQMLARVAIVKQFRVNPQFARSVGQYYGKDYVEELQKVDPAKLEAEADKLYALLTEQYLPIMKPASVAILCQRLNDADDSEALLRAIYTSDKRHEVRGVACLALAQALMRSADRLGAGDARAAEKILNAAEKLLEEAADRYAGVKTAFDGTVGRKARSELFDLRHLAIGKPAPEIEGADQDGKHFKLSDYRGKVVLLDFWSEY